MPRNSQVRGLCNPVVDSSLFNRMLNYHVQCFPELNNPFAKIRGISKEIRKPASLEKF